MKKYVSLFLTMLMILSLATIGVCADTDSTLVYDLDFNSFNGTTIANKGSADTSSAVISNVTKGTHIGDDGSSVGYGSFSGSYIQLQGTSGTRTTDATFEMWIKNDGGWMKPMAIATNTNPVTGSFCLDMGVNSGKMLFAFKKNSSEICRYQSTITQADWAKKYHHIVVTRHFDSDYASDRTGTITYGIYVDGTSLGSVTTGSVGYADQNNVLVGASTTAQIGAFRLYTRKLSDEEINASYKNDVSKFVTVDEYKTFDLDVSGFDGTGATLSDKTGNIKKSATYQITGTPEKKIFTADNGTQIPYVEFDSTERIMLSQDKGGEAQTLFTRKSEESFEMWIRTDFSSWGKIFAITNDGNGTSWALNFGQTSNLIQYEVHYDGKSIVTNKTVPVTDLQNKWHHIVATRKFEDGYGGGDKVGITYKVYVNGNKLIDYTDNDSSHTHYDCNSLYIGSGGSCGDIAEFKAYDTILTDSQVSGKYKASKANYSKFDDTKVMDVNFDNAPTLTDRVNSSVTFWANNMPNVSTYNNGRETKNIISLQRDASSVKPMYFGFGGSQNEGRNAVTGKAETTVEMWIRSDKMSEQYWAKPFTIHHSNNMGTNNANTSWKMEINNGTLYLSGANGSNIGNQPMGDVDGKWTYIVLTRKFDETAQTIEYVAYVNGEELIKGTLNDQTSVGDYASGATKAAAVLFGGNEWAKNCSFDGDMAELKVYTSVMAADVVKARYNSAKDDYTYISNAEKKVTAVTFKSGRSELEDFNSDTEFSAITVDVDSSYDTKQAYMAYMGVYGADGRLLAIYAPTNKSLTLEANGTTEIEFDTDSLDFSNLTLGDGAYIRVFVWSNEAGEEMMPIPADDDVCFTLNYVSEDARQQ